MRKVFIALFLARQCLVTDSNTFQFLHFYHEPVVKVRKIRPIIEMLLLISFRGRIKLYFNYFCLHLFEACYLLKLLNKNITT